MIGILKQFFDPVEDGKTDDASVNESKVVVAACALMLEMAHSDGQFDEAERESMLQALSEVHGLSGEHRQSLLEEAAKARDVSIDMWNFARAINRNYTQDEKMKVIWMLWKVVLADGIIDKHEHYLMGKFTTLLELSPEDCLAARQVAESQ